MLQKEGITRRQLYALMFVGLLSPVFRTLPTLSVAAAGRAAWLSPLAAAPVLVLLVLLAASMLKGRAPGQGLAEILFRVLGAGPGRIVVLLYSLWMALYSGFVLRAGAERLLSTIYANGKAAFFVLVLLGAALWLALGRQQSMMRTAELLYMFLLGTLLVVLLAALPQVRTENLLPVRAADTGAVLRGAVPVIGALSQWFYLLFLCGGLPAEERMRPGAALRRQGLGIGIVFLLTVCTLGTFGPVFLTGLQAPFFVLIRDIRIAGVVERVEALVVALWVITDLFFVAALLSAAGEGLRSVIGKKSRRLPIILCAVLGAAAAILAGGNAFQVKKLSDHMIPMINLVFTLGGSSLIFIVQKIRKK